jgi:hypothetical protein
MLSLAEICSSAGIGRIDSMKIDVEGHEDRALIPFLSSTDPTLWPRQIFMEVVHSGRWEHDCLSAIEGRGYKTAWRGGGDVVLIRQHN